MLDVKVKPEEQGPKLDLLVTRTEQTQTQTYFPVAYVIEGEVKPQLANNPQDLPRGRAFRILLTNATLEKFELVEYLCKQLGDRLIIKL